MEDIKNYTIGSFLEEKYMHLSKNSAMKTIIKIILAWVNNNNKNEIVCKKWETTCFMRKQLESKQ